MSDPKTMIQIHEEITTQGGYITDDQVKQLETIVYVDEVVDADEVKNLFGINDTITASTENSTQWGPFFQNSILNWALADKVFDKSESALYIELAGADDQIDQLEIHTAVALVKNAESIEDPEFVKWVGTALTAYTVADETVDSEEITLLSDFYYGDGGDGGSSVTMDEMNHLVGIKEATKDWSEEFIAFFGKVLCDCLLEDDVIDADETTWVIDTFKSDGIYDVVEIAALSMLKDRATELPEALSFILDMGVTG